jgi:hypothetical protein
LTRLGSESHLRPFFWGLWKIANAYIDFLLFFPVCSDFMSIWAPNFKQFWRHFRYSLHAFFDSNCFMFVHSILNDLEAFQTSGNMLLPV